MYSEYTLDELKTRLLLSRTQERIACERWGPLFLPCDDAELMRRRVRIIYVLLGWRQRPLQSFLFGSLLSLSLDELLALAAHLDRVDIVVKHIDGPDVVGVRHRVAKALSGRVCRRVVKPSGNIPGDASELIPLARLFDPSERQQMKDLFRRQDCNQLMWEYIRRTPPGRVRQILSSRDIQTTKNVKLNQHILFAALQPGVKLPWCSFPRITAPGVRCALTLLLCLLGQKPVDHLELHLTRPSGGPPEDCCAICLSWMTGKKSANVRQTACNHCFHAKCIKRWMREQRTCPLCKSKIW